MLERERGEPDEDYHPQGESGTSVGQVRIQIPGLMPERTDSKGKVLGPGNLRDPNIWKNASEKELKKFREIFNKNRKAGKSIRAKTILGGILLTVAVAGYELGPAHGRHVKPYIKLMKQGLARLEEMAKNQNKQS